ncbi:MAG: AAA family ATPase [Muribaculaceae bacterium]|jgi:hypothetical protein|nr:AAA family ATPase [Muribaculaceae bacterium]
MPRLLKAAIISHIKKLLRRLVSGVRAKCLPPPPAHPSGGISSPCAETTVSYRMVTGGAGTGKSLLLKAEAAAIAKNPRRRLLVITTSEREATAIMASNIGCAGKHSCFVGSARALICSLLPVHLLCADEELLPLLLDHLASVPTPDLPLYTDILIDDTQNLSPTLLRLLDRLAHPDGCRVVYFADPAQAIFGFAGAGSDTLALLRARSGTRVARLRLRHRPAPVVAEPIVTSESNHVVELAVDAATEALKNGGSVALLTRTNAEVAEAAAILSSRDIAHTVLSARLVAVDSPVPPHDRERWRHYALRQADLTATLPDGVTVGTVHTFRDRTANHVIALDTAPFTLRGTSAKAEDRRRIATAIARATSTAQLVKLIPYT